MDGVTQMSVLMQRIAGWQIGEPVGPAIVTAADWLCWNDRRVKRFWYMERSSVDTETIKFAEAAASDAETARAVAKAVAAAAVLEDQAAAWLTLDPRRYRKRHDRMRALASQLRFQHPSVALIKEAAE